MTLWVLTETSAGYALHYSTDKKLLKRDNLSDQLNTVEGASSILKLKSFVGFKNSTQAVEEAAAINESKVSPMLAHLLDELKDEKKATLAVADPKLGNSITKLPQLSIKPVADSTTEELHRAIRTFMPSLIPQLLPQYSTQMSLGLSHSLSRHKLKFSAEKVDVMIIQAVSLLDDLDKEINTYAMRTREWYGWHFPELGKLLNDNLAYAKVVLTMGVRTNSKDADLAEILPEDIEAAVKAAAEVSMGTEISEEDLEIISSLASQVVEFSEYRISLSSFLATRMKAIAPNLTTLVGELVGARLIKHAGSLVNLSKSPASTIQILGAEKALFRALKTKHDTPKYGLIYHASIVGQASGKNKGKIARMLAAKTALGLRVDSLSDWGASGEHNDEEPTEEEKTAIGRAHRIKIDRKLRALEGRPLGPRTGVAIAPAGQTQPGKFNVEEVRRYNPAADGLSVESQAVAGAQGKPLIEEVVDSPDSDLDMSETAANGAPTTDGLTNGDVKELKKKRKRETEEGATNGEDQAVSKAARKAEKTQRKAEKKARQAEKAADTANDVKGLKEEDESSDASETARKAEKLARRAAKKAEKAEKKAAKADKKAEKAEKKKRRHEEAGVDPSERKKKKQKHAD